VIISFEIRELHLEMKLISSVLLSFFTHELDLALMISESISENQQQLTTDVML
jgi:hypothetical protein